MTTCILLTLEQTLRDPDSTEASAPHPDYIGRCCELAAGYHALRQRQAPDERPLRAYLLLDIWDGNPSCRSTVRDMARGRCRTRGRAR